MVGMPACMRRGRHLHAGPLRHLWDPDAAWPRRWGLLAAVAAAVATVFGARSALLLRLRGQRAWHEGPNACLHLLMVTAQLAPVQETKITV